MKGTRHSEEQTIAILKQGEAGLATRADRQPTKSSALHTSSNKVPAKAVPSDNRCPERTRTCFASSIHV